MEDEKKINLRQYTSPKVSKKYLLRIVLYLALFGAIGFIYNRLSESKTAHRNQPEIKEIDNFSIEIE